MRNTFKLALVALSLVTASFAHASDGQQTYKGRSNTGAACSVDIISDDDGSLRFVNVWGMVKSVSSTKARPAAITEVEESNVGVAFYDEYTRKTVKESSCFASRNCYVSKTTGNTTEIRRKYTTQGDVGHLSIDATVKFQMKDGVPVAVQILSKEVDGGHFGLEFRDNKAITCSNLKAK